MPTFILTGPEDLRVGLIINIPTELLQPRQEIALAQWIAANQTPGAHYTGACSLGSAWEQTIYGLPTIPSSLSLYLAILHVQHKVLDSLGPELTILSHTLALACDPL